MKLRKITAIIIAILTVLPLAASCGGDTAQTTDSVVTANETTDQTTETDEETEARLKELYTLINQLGKLERALILLWLEERNYQEMADILGISKVNVGVKLNRIREKLKRMSNS